MTFSEKYPHLAWWIDHQGTLELGMDSDSPGLVRLYDEGGIWWEDEDDSVSLDRALANAERVLATELPERFGADFQLKK